MEKIGKISAIVISVMVVISGIASTAIAYDSNNPWIGTVKWSIPADTSFTVTFAGSQTQINFTASSKTQNEIEPDGQDAANNIPIITIENTGNTELDFLINLTSDKPSWAELKGKATPEIGSAFDISTVGFFIYNISAGGNTSLYLWTNITNAPAGDTERTMMISSYVS